MTEGSMDDLPRTLRRERELRERAAREQNMHEAGRPGQMDAGWDQRSQAASGGPAMYGRGEPANRYDHADLNSAADRVDATVRRIKVPFFSLMAFFIKAVLAAIPALLILIAMLYGLGLMLQTYFPWLIKMKIVISFPG